MPIFRLNLNFSFGKMTLLPKAVGLLTSIFDCYIILVRTTPGGIWCCPWRLGSIGSSARHSGRLLQHPAVRLQLPVLYRPEIQIGTLCYWPIIVRAQRL